MKIEHKTFSIGEISNGYIDDAENGVRAFSEPDGQLLLIFDE